MRLDVQITASKLLHLFTNLLDKELAGCWGVVYVDILILYVTSVYRFDCVDF